MTPAEWGRHLAAELPPLSDVECERAARIVASWDAEEAA